MRTVRRSLAVAATTVALAVPAVAAQAAPTDKPATPPAQLLLAQGEFPAGYQVKDIPRGKVAGVVGDVGKAFATAVVTPAQCRPVVSSATLSQATRLPVVAAVNQATKSTLSEVISSDPRDATAAKPGCEKVHLELNKVGDGIDRLVMDVSTTQTSLAGAPAGTKTVLASSTGSVTVDGRTVPIDQHQLIAITSVRGYHVLVSNARVEPGAAPDRAALAQAITTATNKVRTAK